MIHLEGTRDFTLARPALFAKLTDATFLVQCVPEVESVNHVSADNATFVIRPGLSFVRGTLEIAMQIAAKSPPASAVVLLNSHGIGSSSAVEAALQLHDHGAGTRVLWSAEVKELGGLLKLVPQGLIRGAAQKVIEDVWTAIHNRLATS